MARILCDKRIRLWVFLIRRRPVEAFKDGYYCAPDAVGFSKPTRRILYVNVKKLRDALEKGGSRGIFKR
jgi:hypothetical protein